MASSVNRYGYKYISSRNSRFYTSFPPLHPSYPLQSIGFLLSLLSVNTLKYHTVLPHSSQLRTFRLPSSTLPCYTYIPSRYFGKKMKRTKLNTHTHTQSLPVSCNLVHGEGFGFGKLFSHLLASRGPLTLHPRVKPKRALCHQHSFCCMWSVFLLNAIVYICTVFGSFTTRSWDRKP